ncbi:JAB domain-containing protein [Danxiaibacter flavus]|uniref:JAB domain-containing protein n=1 Tax=Danxiaibacter flavus TaxID=3049108 RepID=A0ABV3ZJF9_9BACT|nr:JAB domain-containing protein [Chitinophagaceae bacterium DXS]
MEQSSFKSLNKVAEVEIRYRNKTRVSERPIIHNSKDAYQILLANWNKDKIEYVEEFKILLLNFTNAVLGISHISSGSGRATIADPKIIFTTALKANASAIILSHCHPSGCLKPSPEDLNLTTKLVECGKLLDIKVLDHLIVTADGYLSICDEGLM